MIKYVTTEYIPTSSFSAEWLTPESHELLLLDPKESYLVVVALKMSSL